MIVKISRDKESFWVKVVEILPSLAGDATCSGIVDNVLGPDNKYKCGDTITFQESEILDIYNEEAGKSERDLILENNE